MAVVIEMEECSQGAWQTTEEGEELQRGFWKNIPETLWVAWRAPVAHGHGFSSPAQGLVGLINLVM